jgi:hypothetical protein
MVYTPDAKFIASWGREKVPNVFDCQFYKCIVERDLSFYWLLPNKYSTDNDSLQKISEQTLAFDQKVSKQKITSK